MPDALLFPNLLSRSTPEDFVTELVAFLLRKDVDLRRWVAAKIWGESGEPGADDAIETAEEIATQVAGDAGGRTDINGTRPRGG